MLTIGIIAGSTRPGRKSLRVSEGVAHAAQSNFASRARFEILDLVDHALPLLDEPVPAIMGDYRHAHTKRWAEDVGKCDGFIFVTPEYNHSIPAALKNAIDYLYAEWNDKAAGFVSYGGIGGARAVEQLRLILAETRTATVRSQILLGPHANRALFSSPDAWTTDDPSVDALNEMLSELLDWSKALQEMRERKASAPSRKRQAQ